MKKRNNIIYWIATVWLSLGMVSTGIVQLIRMPEEIESFNSLGYPEYLMTILGVWKLAGVVAILIPRYALLKEWAYAGMFFMMSGALASHIFSGHGLSHIAPTLLLLALIITSWYFRPQCRKIQSTTAATC